MPTATPGGGGTNCSSSTNIAAASNGGRLIGGSTGSGYEKVIDGNPNTGWVSGAGSIADQYLVVALPDNKVHTINKVRINPAANGGGQPDRDLKDFEVRVSNTDAYTTSFITVYKGTIPNNRNAFFDFTFPAVQAKWVGLWTMSNYGNNQYVEVAEFEVYEYDPNGSCSGGGGSGNPTPIPAPTSTPISGGGGQCSGIPANQNMTVSPSDCAKAGATFVFEASGFTPGENVQASVKAPDGTVYPAGSQLTADQTGAIRSPNALTLSTVPGTAPGIYMTTMEGVTSHFKATGYIKILAP